MSAKEDLNIFFDDCIHEVQGNLSFIRKYIEISDECVNALKFRQPTEIDISTVVKHIAESGGYERKIVHGLRGDTPQSTYTKPFNSPLSSVFFCYYRFLFIRRLNHEQYNDIAIDIVYDTFLRFMRYVNIEIINSGKQITSLLNIVLQSNLVNEYQHSKKYQRYYENHKISYEDALSEIDKLSGGYEIGTEDGKPLDSRQRLLYLTEYIVDILPYEYELHNELTEMINGKRKELSDYSHNIIERWKKENDVSGTLLMRRAILNHAEYTAKLDLS